MKPNEFSTQTLAEIYDRYKEFCDKGTTHSYIDLYEDLFSGYRHTAKNILEVGVWKGASLLMWRDYFSFAKIFGVDISPIGMKNNNRVFLEFGCSTSPVVASRLKERAGKQFDIIIDDGSHFLKDQINTFNNLRCLLAVNGLYAVEDLRTSKDSRVMRRYFEGLGFKPIIYNGIRKLRHDDRLVYFFNRQGV